jgi:hypothetical protein
MAQARRVTVPVEFDLDLDSLRQQIRDLPDAVQESVDTMHAWLNAERQHFTHQGYSDEQARAMAAATYVTVFGVTIRRLSSERPGDVPGLPPSR